MCYSTCTCVHVYRGEKKFLISLLSPGFVDVFSDNKEAVVNHGRKLLKVSSSCLCQEISNKFEANLIDRLAMESIFWLQTLFLMMLQHNLSVGVDVHFNVMIDLNNDCFLFAVLTEKQSQQHISTFTCP